MKKFLFMLLLLPFCIGKVFASDVYYSAYTPFSDWQEQPIVSSDTIQVEEETRYLWYQIHQMPGGYALFESGGQFLNDCYNTDLSSWTTVIPATHESRSIQERTKYIYKLDTGIRYIHLTNVSGSYYSFRIPELNVIVNGQDIAYTYTCNGCNDTFDSHIHNGNRYENWSSLTNGGSLTIDLGTIYPAHKVELQFYIYDVGNDPKNYTVSFSRDGINMLASQSYTLYFSGMEYDQAEYRVHNIYNMGVDESVWTTTDITYTPYTNDFQLSTNTEKEYAYTERWCRTYTENREYSTDYWKVGNASFPYQDTSQAKKYYRYQTRNKLELNDISIIDKKIDNWDHFVLNASKPYTVIDNINWLKNGLYSVTFQVGDLEVTKEIDVQLMENKIDEYEKQIADLNNHIEQLQNEYQTQKALYEQQIQSLEEEIENLKQRLQECEENCKRDKECLQDTIQQKNDLLEKYEKQILELSNTVNEYQVKLEEQNQTLASLQNEIDLLQGELKRLKESNKGLENEIVEQEEKLKEFEQDISNLTDNNEYYQKLLEEKQEKIVNMEKDNMTYLKNIEELKQELENMVQDREQVQEEYQQQLKKKDQLIDAYYNKIQELLKQLEGIKGQISEVIIERDTINKDGIKLQEELQNLKKENTELKDKLKEQEQGLEVCSNLNQENDILNEKLNNYMLKIKGEDKFNLLWVYIPCLILFLISIIYKWRKKSNVK